MKHLSLWISVVALALAAAACGIFDPEGTNPYKPLKLDTKSAEYARKGNAFSFEFIDRINSVENGDFIISPLSMQFLLGLLLNGAQGQTAEEISRVLGYGAGETAAVNEYCLAMMQQLPDLDKKTKLAIADAIFVNKNYPILDSYKNSVGKYYLAEVANLDFSNKTSSLNAINGWCSRNTNKMIPKVLDDVNPNELAYLLNALYFKSEWQDKFPKGNTAEASFTAESGKVRKVPMMKTNGHYPYQDNDDFRAVRLTYGNGAYSMMVILPAEGKKLFDVTAALRRTDWDAFVRSMVGCEVDMWLPKFETKYSKKLNQLLSDMGMPSSFDPVKADFKAMSEYAMCLEFVKQDAIIKVDEEGTEAAAVSMAGMMPTAAAPGQHIVFHADRPFLYLITESSTGAVLFAGKYCGK